jgi:response regulator RpfG family c-di-GMP phosphodiesterase
MSERVKPRILCVDDEQQILESLRDTLRRRFDVVGTTNGFEALRMLVAEPFPAVLSDMRMPKLHGSRFLTLAREHAPDTVRLLLTGQSTLQDAVTAVNDGQIFRFLVKPCASRELIDALDAAVALYEANATERSVRAQIVTGMTEALFAMATTVDPSARARAERVCRDALALVPHADGAVQPAVLERAVRLAQLGSISISADTRAHLAGGRQITREQAAEIAHAIETSERFLAAIPRLESERSILMHLSEPLVAGGHGLVGTPAGARILRIAIDFDLLEAQGIPPKTALESMQARADRYDTALLGAFGTVQALL